MKCEEFGVLLLKRNERSFKEKIINKKALILKAVGIIVGLPAGYAYYHFVGCNSGTCAITSNSLNSNLYGGLMGGLLFNMFVTSPKKKE